MCCFLWSWPQTAVVQTTGRFTVVWRKCYLFRSHSELPRRVRQDILNLHIGVHVGRVHMGPTIFWGAAAPVVSHLSLDLTESGLGSALWEAPSEMFANSSPDSHPADSSRPHCKSKRQWNSPRSRSLPAWVSTSEEHTNHQKLENIKRYLCVCIDRYTYIEIDLYLYIPLYMGAVYVCLFQKSNHININARPLLILLFFPQAVLEKGRRGWKAVAECFSVAYVVVWPKFFKNEFEYMFTIKYFSEFRSFSAGRCGCHDPSGSNKCCDGNEDKNLSG